MNMDKNLKQYNEKLQRHISFWNKEKVDRPMFGFSIGDYFLTQKFEAIKRILGDKKLITPDMIIFENFIDDYERLFSYSQVVDQDIFWVAEPFPGIPWIEGFLGCEIYANNSSLSTEPIFSDIKEIGEFQILEENLWYKKYINFIDSLQHLSNGRFPVGQPILRGITDIMGALLGQSKLIYCFYDNPELIKTLCERIRNVFLKVIKQQQTRIVDFLGGYSIGFYHIWCPSSCIWIQDDITSLLSPKIYENFIFKHHEYICNQYDYNLFHLHPSSFSILDKILEIKNLKIVQINKDDGGPNIKDMLPVFKKVLKNKRLCIVGHINEGDIYEIKNNLTYEGLYLQIFSPSVDKANRLAKIIKNW